MNMKTGSVDLRLADKLDELASSLDAKITDCFRDRSENTNKQRSQAASARFDGHNLRSAQDALRALAEGWRNGTVPDLCRKFKSKKAVLDAVRVKMIRQSQGFHDLIYPDVNNPADTSPEAVSLRKFVESEPDEQYGQKMELTQKLAAARTFNIPGFFPTPDSVIDIMLDGLDVAGKLVLEPSAGIGSIADRVAADGGFVHCVERNYSLCEILELKMSLNGYLAFEQNDFLEMCSTPQFDFVLMNPPFENNVDIDHVMHAATFLNRDGELRAIMGAGSVRRDAHQKKIREFHEWLDDSDLVYSFTELPAGSFKNAFRTTGVSCWMLGLCMN